MNLRRLSTKQVTKARKVGTPATPRDSLCPIEIHLDRFHCGAPRVRRKHPNNNCGRLLYEDVSLRPLAQDGYSNRRSTSIQEGNLESTWPTNRYRLGVRHKMD